ncbi:MAG: phosphate/phosphite/phosphonate ABC transporter substrate-binding protein [Desulfobulbales bacterium]|nr:phosphate/phosphite/phosphonate ABC transporter substrate-binding protein [Desulfobulbales bacterium]
MRKFITTVVTAVLGIALISCTSAPQQEKQEKELETYRIGYMICNSEKETLERFVPFTAFLSKKLGVNFEPVAIDTINFTREMDSLDFTHTNSLLYVILNRFHGVDILAAEKKGSLAEKSQGIIIARSDSTIKNIADLKGKTMIFGPTLGPTGFMSQVDMLQEAGIDPDNDLAFYTIPAGSFKHEKVAYGVLFERYDAGALPLDDIEIMTADGRLDPDDFTIVARAEPIPYCNFGVNQKIDESLARKFKDAVLGITADDTVEINGEVIKVLDRALVDGYVDITDSDFDTVREMAKRTNMPPYQKF